MQYEISPCTKEESDFIDEQSDQYILDSSSLEVEDEEKVFVYQVTDQEGHLLGGCVLITDKLKTGSIIDLWVEEAHRGHGIGSALIQEAERKAKELGCYLAMIGTFDFQAKPFYDKLGYTLITKTHDYPKGHEHYFMQKRIDRHSEGTATYGLCGYEIRLADKEVAEGVAEELSDRLIAFDEACVPREHEYISISKKVTDETGKIIAGIVGGVDGWNGTEIESIWVDEAYRRQGIGSALVRAFEQAAKENGAGTMLVEPYDWNMDFFRKNGYVTITGMLEDYPKGHTMYCMEKPL